MNIKHPIFLLKNCNNYFKINLKDLKTTYLKNYSYQSTHNSIKIFNILKYFKKSSNKIIKIFQNKHMI